MNAKKQRALTDSEANVTDKVKWNAFTSIRSNNSVKDLIRLCHGQNGHSILMQSDARGLFPIHWASINNRPDMIDYMILHKVPRDLACHDDTVYRARPLHLTALNGSIEAASVLLSCHFNKDTDTNKEYNQENANTNSRSKQATTIVDSVDSVGQTALMRCAINRRSSSFCYLFTGGNYWSLSARPSQMALYLMVMGADWRIINEQSGFNLMHLAVINDCHDIVHLLLAIDDSLANVFSVAPAKSSNRTANYDEQLDQINLTDDSDDFLSYDDSDTIQLFDSSTIHGHKKRNSSRKNTKIKKKDHLASIKYPLLPLDLAIIYKRTYIIKLLWKTTDLSRSVIYKKLSANSGSPDERSELSLDTKKTLEKINEFKLDRMNDLILRTYITNRRELFKLLWFHATRFIIFLELLLAVVWWYPRYISIHSKSDENSWFVHATFMLTSVLTILFCCHTSFKDPGYLKRNTIQYLNELIVLIKRNPRFKKTQLHAIEDNAEALETTSKNANQLRTNHHNNDDRENIPIEERVKLLCHSCKCLKRPRSRHCDKCNHCVQDFDHHCLYLNSCIGKENRLDFLMASILLTLTSVYGAMILNRSQQSNWFDLLWIAKFIPIASWKSFCTLRRACIGITQYEEIRYRQTKGFLAAMKGNSRKRTKNKRSAEQVDSNYDLFYREPNWFDGRHQQHKISENLKEFANVSSLKQCLYHILFDPRTSQSVNNSDINIYRYV